MSENGLDELRRRLLERAGLTSRNREMESQEKVKIRDLVVDKEHFKFVFLDPDLTDNDETFMGVVYIPENDLFLIKRTEKDVDSIHDAMIDQAS